LALEDVTEPVAATAPQFVHPIMDWGKSYQADLNWPEFQDHASSDEHVHGALPAFAEPPQERDNSGLALHQPAALAPLAWTPAPSHETYDELGPLILEPANDPHERL
jgi:hypothetical protein